MDASSEKIFLENYVDFYIIYEETVNFFTDYQIKLLRNFISRVNN